VRLTEAGGLDSDSAENVANDGAHNLARLEEAALLLWAMAGTAEAMAWSGVTYYADGAESRRSPPAVAIFGL